MKNSTFLSFFVLVFVFCQFNAFSQYADADYSAQEDYAPIRLTIYGGLALPQGDFGSTSVKEKSGYASTGFCAMIENSSTVNETIKWVSSLSLALNSFDESALKNNFLPSSLSVSAGSYYTTWAMTGIGFETAVSPTTNIYVLGQIGLLLSSFPDIELSYGGSSITQTATMGTAFGFGFGFGVIFDKINLGLRYYSGEPEYELSYDDWTETEKLPAAVIQLMVGLRL